MPFPYALRALNHRNFRVFYYGLFISTIGSWIQTIATTWLAYKISGSPAISGLVGFSSQIPTLLVSPFAGVLGDRIDRKKMLLIVQYALIVQASILALLIVTDMMTVSWLVVLSLCLGLINAFETPTRQAMYAFLLDDRSDLPNAIALNSVLMNGTRLIGPALGGVLIATTSIAVCFVVNAVLTIATLVALLEIKLPPIAHSEHKTKQGFIAELAEGWRYATSLKPVRYLLVMVALVSFTITPYSTLMPAYAVMRFAGEAKLVGLLISAVGLGALMAALRLSVRKDVRGLTTWVAGFSIGGGVAMMALSQSRVEWLSLLILVVFGFCILTTFASMNTIVQSIIDDDKRGRVVSLYSAAFIGSGPIGQLASGWLAEHIGASNTFLINGIACTIIGIIFTFKLPRMRAALRPIYIERGIIPVPVELEK